jgi:hypothetical protein
LRRYAPMVSAITGTSVRHGRNAQQFSPLEGGLAGSAARSV